MDCLTKTGIQIGVKLYLHSFQPMTKMTPSDCGLPPPCWKYRWGRLSQVSRQVYSRSEGLNQSATTDGQKKMFNKDDSADSSV